jgi:hypothetical protein
MLKAGAADGKIPARGEAWTGKLGSRNCVGLVQFPSGPILVK